VQHRTPPAATAGGGMPRSAGWTSVAAWCGGESTGRSHAGRMASRSRSTMCDVTLCQRPDHLQLLTKSDNVKRRGPTRGRNQREASEQQAPKGQTEIHSKIGNNVDAERLALELV